MNPRVPDPGGREYPGYLSLHDVSRPSEIFRQFDLSLRSTPGMGANQLGVIESIDLNSSNFLTSFKEPHIKKRSILQVKISSLYLYTNVRYFFISLIWTSQL
jgi:hypothetical protein